MDRTVDQTFQVYVKGTRPLQVLLASGTIAKLKKRSLYEYIC